MKEQYFIRLRNELFIQGFSFAEMCDILTDTAAYFADAKTGETEELVQDAVWEKLGTPKEFAKSIRQSNPSQSAGRLRFFRMILLFLIPVTFLIGMYFLAAEKQQHINRQAVVSILVFASNVMLWFTGGNLCLFGILPVTKKQVKKWICFQLFLFLLLIIFLYGIYVGVPAYIKTAESQNILHTVGPAVQFAAVLYVALCVVLALYCLVAFLKAEWLMLGIFMQSIGLLCCAVFYQQYLGNLTVFDNIQYFPLPLLLSVLFSSIIYIMILRSKGGK